ALAAANMEIPRSRKDYSATMVIQMKQGQIEQKVYYTPGKERREMAMATGSEFVVITREDLGKMWIMMNPQSYTEQDLEGDGVPGTENGTVIIDVEDLGWETLDGSRAHRYHVKMQMEDGTKMDSDIWMNDDDIPVRMELKAKGKGGKFDGTVTTHDIVMAKQDPSLFELPEGAQPMSMGQMATMDGFPGSGGFGKDMADAAKQGVINESRYQVTQGTRKAIRKGLRSIFN
ncbi:MAG: hypothetical protein R3190_01960, partial [Thermoanaerobaculia bacterium]|nr:hypothetical protein [Thermoanaerobaculia bacterium]